MEIDPDTGKVTILRYAAASDCGTVIFPLGAEGQVEGSIAQGMGYTLSEGLLWDNGRPVNPNFSDYRLPTAGDMPRLEREFADSYEPTGPFGAKGLGELPMDGPAPAVVNALRHLGLDVREIPATPELLANQIATAAARPRDDLGAGPRPRDDSRAGSRPRDDSPA